MNIVEKNISKFGFTKKNNNNSCMSNMIVLNSCLVYDEMIRNLKVLTKTHLFI